jgi:hypothetical protein
MVPGVDALAQSVNSQGAYGRVIRIDRSGFKPNAGLIRFSEFAVNTKNPVYQPANYGGDSKGVTVMFGGWFVGQRRGDRESCQGGGAITGCVVGAPTAPLQIDNSSPPTFIAEDTSSKESPVLSGTPQFNGPISMLFDQNVAGVGLVGGYFDAAKGTSILAFDRNGRQIGGVVNLALGMEYMALVTEDGSESIAGLQFSLVGPEPAGFAIDNLSFARRSELQGAARPSGGAGPTLGDFFKGRPGGGGDTVPRATPTPASPAPAPAAPGKSLQDLFR